MSSSNFYVGLDLTSFSKNGNYKPVSRVTLLLDDNNEISVGDDTGLEVVANCPHGTKTMAEAIYNQIAGYVYKSYEAQDANIDPSAELGDAVTSSGVLSVISKISDDGSGYPSLSAPGGAELEEDFESISYTEALFNRKISGVHSAIEKNAEEIKLYVIDEVNELSATFDLKLDSISTEIKGLDGKYSTISQTVDSISATVSGLDGKYTSLDLTVDGLTTKVSGLDGQYSALEVRVDNITYRVNGLEVDYSEIEQYVDSITLTVSNGTTSSRIELKAGSTTIASNDISFSGYVTFTGLSGGTTTIDGACIKTGKIDADRLNLTGAITFSDLSDDVTDEIDDISSTANSAYNKANNALSAAEDAEDTVSGWTYGSTTYIDGAMIKTGTVMASKLQGGTVELLDASEDTVAIFKLARSSSASSGVRLESYGALALFADEGDVYITAPNYITLSSDEISCVADIRPSRAGSYSCGTSGYPWSEVYAETSEINTSDKNKKNNIEYNLDRYENLFDLLRPVRYKYNDGTSDRYHTGFIAQDVEAALEQSGLTTQEFGGFVVSVDGDDGAKNYALRYSEFIALCVQEIQKLKETVKELEAMVNDGIS